MEMDVLGTMSMIGTKNTLQKDGSMTIVTPSTPKSSMRENCALPVMVDSNLEWIA